MSTPKLLTLNIFELTESILEIIILNDLKLINFCL